MSALEEAERAGIDLSLIEVSLGYSYDKCALQHQAALELALMDERRGQIANSGSVALGGCCRGVSVTTDASGECSISTGWQGVTLAAVP